MIEIKNKRDCSGCTACQSICPTHCISMSMDKEGFLYPNVDNKNCIECGVCEKICPILKPIPLNNYIPTAYVVQNLDENIRRQSSSGGAFTALAEWVISQDGYVFGGAFDESFHVKHIMVDNVTDLSKLRCSKYVQSNLEGCFHSVKELLINGQLVLFSGTPCQINGLKSFLKKEYLNLITVDVVCHGTPSPGLWDSYLQWYLSKQKNGISSISFRDKPFGYAGSTMSIKDTDGKYKYTTREVQFFKKMYFADINNRPSCFSCHFKSIKRNTDFTLFDCWHLNKINSLMDDDKGTTWVIIQSQKGENIFEQIKEKISYYQSDVNIAISLDGDMALSCPSPSPLREQFFYDYNILDFQSLVNKYNPKNFKNSIIGYLKPIMHKLGILKTMKRFFNN